MERDFDALMPAEMAEKAERIGVQKATATAFDLFVLAVLAGAFIALGAAFSTTVATATDVPFGVHRLLIGLSFSLGLILVIVGGAELFTGNNLIAMAWASRRIGFGAVLRNWGIVYLGNAVGSFGTALLIHTAGVHEAAGGAVGRTAVSIAAKKMQIGFIEAVALGVLCNALVCLAVWLSFSGRSTVDRIVAIVFPVTAFVAMGLEHCVANLYFIPAGMLASPGLEAFTVSEPWIGFARNLVPVTLGNIVGGTGLVALVYWAVYRRSALAPTD